jgi:hypothetical protein
VNVRGPIEEAALVEKIRKTGKQVRLRSTTSDDLSSGIASRLSRSRLRIRPNFQWFEGVDMNHCRFSCPSLILVPSDC